MNVISKGTEGPACSGVGYLGCPRCCVFRVSTLHSTVMFQQKPSGLSHFSKDKINLKYNSLRVIKAFLQSLFSLNKEDMH